MQIQSRFHILEVSISFSGVDKNWNWKKWKFHTLCTGSYLWLEIIASIIMKSKQKWNSITFCCCRCLTLFYHCTRIQKKSTNVLNALLYFIPVLYLFKLFKLKFLIYPVGTFFFETVYMSCFSLQINNVRQLQVMSFYYFFYYYFQAFLLCL